MNFVVFIENKSYVHFTLPYLEVLKNIGIDFSVLTLEELQHTAISNVDVKVLLSKQELNKYMSNLNCDYFLTTTPGIGNFYFPKSKIYPKKSRPKYIYFFHSLVSPNENYVDKSFEGFDYIFAPNSVIADQLKFLINEKYTRVFTVGYQNLNKNIKQNFEKLNLGNVLLAPSWGEDNLFSKENNHRLVNLINSLEENQLKVYLRPHPMEIETIRRMEKELQFNVYLSDIVDHSYFDYLITDWSGISLEYFYSTNNPVGFVNTPKKRRRKLKRNELNLELIENQIIDHIGPKLDLDNIEINKLLNFQHKPSKYIQSLYNPIFDKRTLEKKFKEIFN